MAKGKTQFTCVERRIDKGVWRWAVSYLGECLGSGIVKTQLECRVEKNRVKREWLAKTGLPTTTEELYNDFNKSFNRLNQRRGGV